MKLGAVILGLFVALPARALAPAVEQAQKALEAGSARRRDRRARGRDARRCGPQGRRRRARRCRRIQPETQGSRAHAPARAEGAQAAPQHAHGLELAAASWPDRAAYGAAERYADKWILMAPKDPAARVLRAELAIDQGEWQRAIDFAKPVGRAARPRAARPPRARGETAARRARALREGHERAEIPAGPAARRERRRARPLLAATKGVVVYDTSWCGYCKKLKAWLRAEEHRVRRARRGDRSRRRGRARGEGAARGREPRRRAGHRREGHARHRLRPSGSRRCSRSETRKRLS